jgi:hypothetical protein
LIYSFYFRFDDRKKSSSSQSKNHSESDTDIDNDLSFLINKDEIEIKPIEEEDLLKIVDYIKYNEEHKKNEIIKSMEEKNQHRKKKRKM